MPNALSFLADPEYWQSVRDRAGNALSTAYDRSRNGQAILTGKPIVNSLHEQIAASPDSMAVDWAVPIGKFGMMASIRSGQDMARMIREAQAQIDAENAAKNALRYQPDTHRVRNVLVGLGAGGAGLAGGYYGTDYLTK